MGLRAKTIHGIGWTVSGRVAIQIFQYFVSVVMARILTPADFGRVGMVAVFTGFASIFVDFGIGAALLERRVVEDEQWDAAFSATLSVGVVLFGLIFAAAPLVGQYYGKAELVNITRVSALGFIFSAAGIVPRVLFQRRLQIKSLAILDFCGAFSACAVGALLALMKFGIWSIVAMSLVGPAMSSSLAYWRCQWRPRTFFKFRAARSLMRMSLHLLAFNVINYWARSLDNLLIGKRLGDVELGFYSRSYSLMLLPLSQITGVIAVSMLPAMTRAAHDKVRVLRGYLGAIRMIAFICFPMMAGLALVSRSLILVVYGAKWAPIGPLLEVLAVVGLLQSLSNPTGWIYVSQGRTDKLTIWGLGACSAIIVSIVIGVRMGSSLAVARAYLVANLVLVPIGISYSGSLIGLKLSGLLREIFPTIVATVAMAAMVAFAGRVLPPRFGAGMHLLIQVPGGLFVYWTLSHLLHNRALAELMAFVSRQRETGPGESEA